MAQRNYRFDPIYATICVQQGSRVGEVGGNKRKPMFVAQRREIATDRHGRRRVITHGTLVSGSRIYPAHRAAA